MNYSILIGWARELFRYRAQGPNNGVPIVFPITRPSLSVWRVLLVFISFLFLFVFVNSFQIQSGVHWKNLFTQRTGFFVQTVRWSIHFTLITNLPKTAPYLHVQQLIMLQGSLLRSRFLGGGSIVAPRLLTLSVLIYFHFCIVPLPGTEHLSVLWRRPVSSFWYTMIKKTRLGLIFWLPPSRTPGRCWSLSL